MHSTHNCCQPLQPCQQKNPHRSYSTWVAESWEEETGSSYWESEDHSFSILMALSHWYCSKFVKDSFINTACSKTASILSWQYHVHRDPLAQRPLHLSPPSQTEPGGWQILSVSTSAASSTKHHICAHSSPKEFGRELLSNLHNLYVLHIITRVCSWVALSESRSCFLCHPIDCHMTS